MRAWKASQSPDRLNLIHRHSHLLEDNLCKDIFCSNLGNMHKFWYQMCDTALQIVTLSHAAASAFSWLASSSSYSHISIPWAGPSHYGCLSLQANTIHEFQTDSRQQLRGVVLKLGVLWFCSSLMEYAVHFSQAYTSSDKVLSHSYHHHW